MNSSNIFNPSAIHNPPTILPQLLNGRAGEYRTSRGLDEAGNASWTWHLSTKKTLVPLSRQKSNTRNLKSIESIPIHGTHLAIFWRLHQSRNKSSQSIPRKYERTPDAFRTLISVPRKPELGSQSTILIQSWRNLEILSHPGRHTGPRQNFFFGFENRENKYRCKKQF